MKEENFLQLAEKQPLQSCAANCYTLSGHWPEQVIRSTVSEGKHYLACDYRKAVQALFIAGQPPAHPTTAAVWEGGREQKPQGWGTNQSVRVAASEKHTFQHLRAAAQDTGLCSQLDQRSNTLPRKPNVKSTYWYFHTYLRRHSLLEPWQFSSSILNHQMYFGGVFIHIILLITVLSTKTEFKSIHNIFNYSNNTLINYKLTKFLYLLKKSFIKC